MNLPKLFVTDLDNTALRPGDQPYARFTDVFSEFLDTLAAKGCQWAINTTWDIKGQWELVLASAVKSKPVFLMGELGHRLAVIENGQPVMPEPFTSDTDREVEKVNHSHLYGLVKDISGRFSPSLCHFYGHLYDFRVVKSEREIFSEYAAANYTSDEILTCDCKSNGIVAYPAFLNKGRSLREALRLSGIRPESVVAAGDNIADTEMMHPELAHHALCPENADDDVKEHVLSMNGVVGRGECAEGVVDAFNRLAERHGWDWEQYSC